MRWSQGISASKACIFVTTWFSDFSIYQNHLENWLKQFLETCPRDYDSVCWDEACEFELLTSWRLMLMLLLQGPHFEKHHAKDRYTCAAELWQLQFTLECFSLRCPLCSLPWFLPFSIVIFIMQPPLYLKMQPISHIRARLFPIPALLLSLALNTI